LVFFASTTVCCAGRPASGYRAAKEPLPRVPTAFQGLKCARGGLKCRKYQVRARYQVRANPLLRDRVRPLAFTRYSFTSRLLCTNQPSFHSPRPPALSTLVQHYCTIIGQYTSPLPTSRLYAICHTILVITISCKGHFARRGGALAPTLDLAYAHSRVNPRKLMLALTPSLSLSPSCSLAPTCAYACAYPLALTLTPMLPRSYLRLRLRSLPRSHSHPDAPSLLLSLMLTLTPSLSLSPRCSLAPTLAYALAHSLALTLTPMLPRSYSRLCLRSLPRSHSHPHAPSLLLSLTLSLTPSLSLSPRCSLTPTLAYACAHPLALTLTPMLPHSYSRLCLRSLPRSHSHPHAPSLLLSLTLSLTPSLSLSP